eukprot:COSAG06_NODE_548_length_14433_cov_15.096623_11_plen_145_part_00
MPTPAADLRVLNVCVCRGGSYERLQEQNKSVLLRQRAELIVQLEAVLPERHQNDPELFPRWLCWYQPQEKEVEATAENGVINGVTQKLGEQTKEIYKRIDQIEELQLQTAKKLDRVLRGLDEVMNDAALPGNVFADSSWEGPGE